MAGLGVDRVTPRHEEFDLYVANASPRERTDLVRFPLDFHPYVVPSLNPMEAMHSTVLQDLGAMRFTVDGVPARLVPAETGRMKFAPERGVFDLEFVAQEIPALGFRRVKVRRAPDDFASLDQVDTVEPGTDEASISMDGIRITVRDDGRFDLKLGDQSYSGLGELEDRGDRGDSYDYDEVCEGHGLSLESVSVQRRIHPGGVQELQIVRRLRMPARLVSGRDARSEDEAGLEVEMLLRIASGVERVDLEVRIENAAEDHRLRLLFPVSGPVERFEAATTFDTAMRRPGPSGEAGWMQSPPATFPHQGFVHVNGLSVVAPGLPEAEVISGEPSRIAITLLRCVGSLSRLDLRSRPGPAGPGTDTPGAQCQGTLRARLSVFDGHDQARAREAEVGLRAVVCGDEPVVPQTEALFLLEPSMLMLSAFKPAERGHGVVFRVLNPTSSVQQARVTLGLPFDRAEPLRLDESPADFSISRSGQTLSFPVFPHELRTVGIG